MEDGEDNTLMAQIQTQWSGDRGQKRTNPKNPQTIHQNKLPQTPNTRVHHFIFPWTLNIAIVTWHI